MAPSTHIRAQGADASGTRRFLGLGCSTVSLEDFLAGSLFAGEPHLPSSETTMADFDASADGWTMLVPLEVDDSAHPGDLSSVDGWSDIDSAQEDRTKAAKSKSWRGSLSMNYKAGTAAITSTLCTLWMDPKVVKIVTAFAKATEASVIALAARPTVSLQKVSSPGRPDSPERAHSRASRRVVDVTISGILVHFQNSVDPPPLTEPMQGHVAVIADSLHLCYRGKAAVPLEELERLHGPFASTSCRPLKGPHAVSTVEVDIKGLRATVQPSISQSSSLSGSNVLEPCRVSIRVTKRQGSDSSGQYTLASAEIEHMRFSLTPPQASTVFSTAHHFSNPKFPGGVMTMTPLSEDASDTCRLVIDVNTM